MNATRPHISQLPTRMPVLSMPGVALAPKGKISLRLASPKMIEMVYAALASERMIVIVQNSEKNPFLVGCAGRITGFMESDEGMTLYVLGVCRVLITGRIKTSMFDVVDVDYAPFKEDFNDATDDALIPEILFALDVYVRVNKMDLSSSLFRDLSLQELIASLMSILPLRDVEKQALLEKKKLKECAQALLILLKMDTTPQKEKGQC